MKTLWIAAAMLLAGTLAGCGSGSDNDSAFDQTTSVTAAIAAATHSQAQAITDIQTKLSADEVVLSKVQVFGHAPGAKTAAVRTDGVRTLAMLGEPDVSAQPVSYGPCADMGQQIGANGDPTGATVLTYKQCPINGAQYVYGAVVNGGAISQPTNGFLWFTQPNCQGTPIIFLDDGSYNRLTLDGGVVFTSPVDGVTELMIVAQGQQGATNPATMVSASIYDSGCINATETHTAYTAVPNATSVTGVPAAVPDNFVN